MNHEMVDKVPPRQESNLTIRKFILENTTEHPTDLTRLARERFGLSREAIGKHIRRLVLEGLLEAEGNTRGRIYRLRDIVDERFSIELVAGVEEDELWRRNVRPALHGLSDNVIDICHYGFTEMFNNVIDHSESNVAQYWVKRNALTTEIAVNDRGIGVFEKIRRHFRLEDARHALLELSKGKLTSDPAAHTGEGIFFASQMFDRYSIRSGTLWFDRTNQDDADWLLDVSESPPFQGTLVLMKIQNDSPRSAVEVFERYASGEDLGFVKTIVPVKLAQYEGEKLVSRSQAKRLVARFDRFVEVILDFRGVTDIGPAFADEIFRVYASEHPDVHLYSINTLPDVLRAITRAGTGEEAEQPPLL